MPNNKQDHIDVIITYGATCLTKKQQKLSNLRFWKTKFYPKCNILLDPCLSAWRECSFTMEEHATFVVAVLGKSCMCDVAKTVHDVTTGMKRIQYINVAQLLLLHSER